MKTAWKTINTFFVFSILISLSLNACKEKPVDDDPDPNPLVPVLTIETGKFEQFTSQSFVNQDTIYVDSLPAPVLNVYVSENRLPTTDPLELDSVQFAFTVRTNNDMEYFNSMQNATAYSRSIFEFGNSRQIEGDVLLPFKWSSTAVQGNDTLEMDPSGDVLGILYSSYHSHLMGDETRIVQP